MNIKEAHFMVFDREDNPTNSANAFCGQSYIYAPTHAKFEQLKEPREEKLLLSNQYNLDIQEVVFHFQPGSDTAVSTSSDDLLPAGKRILVGGNVDDGDELTLIGYRFKQPFQIPVEVSYIRGQHAFIIPKHKEDEIYPGMSGSALIRDPNGSYIAIAMLSTGFPEANTEVDLIRIMLGQKGDRLAKAEILF